MGVNGCSKQDESPGETEDLLVENGQTVRTLILSVSGFLGMDERYVAVDPSSITLMRSGNMKAVRAVLDARKTHLRSAPTFDWSKSRR